MGILNTQPGYSLPKSRRVGLCCSKPAPIAAELPYTILVVICHRAIRGLELGSVQLPAGRGLDHLLL